MYLLDTNVLSEVRKPGRASPDVVRWAGQTPAELQYVSAITIMEIERGILILQRRDAIQGRDLRDWLEGQLLPRFHHRILDVDVEIGRQAAALHTPNPRPYSDALIAATALVHGLTVVTRNVADFAPMGVAVLNPWDEG